VDRQYDVFEKFPDGSLIWKGNFVGLENAIQKLQEFATTTENECCLMYLPTKAVIASMNVPNGNDLKQQP
jgi:hypothetical protein